MSFEDQVFFGNVGKNCGDTRPFVICSNANAYLISFASDHAVPTNIIPVVCVDAGAVGRLPEAAAAGTLRSPNGTRIDG